MTTCFAQLEHMLRPYPHSHLMSSLMTLLFLPVKNITRNLTLHAQTGKYISIYYFNFKAGLHPKKLVHRSIVDLFHVGTFRLSEPLSPNHLGSKDQRKLIWISILQSLD
jgi:hypothetical protein